MPRFCANLNFMFQEASSLIERYSLAKKAGFQAVECATPYVHQIDDIVRAKNEAGLEQVLINVAIGKQELGELGFAAILGKEEQFMDSFNSAVEYAKALNCKRIHIMSGVVPNPTTENHELYERNMSKAASILERENLLGLIEPINNWSVPGYYMNDYSRAISIVEKYPVLKLQLDIFHLQHLKGNLTHNIKEFIPFVGHIQIAQVPNRNEPDTDGEINYDYIFHILDEIGYNDWIGLEYKPLNSTESGLKWMKSYKQS